MHQRHDLTDLKPYFGYMRCTELYLNILYHYQYSFKYGKYGMRSGDGHLPHGRADDACHHSGLHVLLSGAREDHRPPRARRVQLGVHSGELRYNGC